MPEPTKQTEYEKLKKELHQKVLKKKQMDDELTAIEEDIFNMETAYLTNNSSYGNIIKGFENFTKSSHSNNNPAARKRYQFTDNDRIFSLSSSTYVRHLKKLNEENGADRVNFDAECMDDEEGDEEEDEKSSNGQKKKKRDD
ncbi:BA75_00990T0 [Komagataella pastoris]|uniref:Chromatin modification-related protein EAF6 n=1 Tax=Komagataella pastoris TaxID=4922 RepID=A0A1B2J5R4_PICPA|nr:BA75_00990T0 [Komagataella pastoris]